MSVKRHYSLNIPRNIPSNSKEESEVKDIQKFKIIQKLYHKDNKIDLFEKRTRSFVDKIDKLKNHILIEKQDYKLFATILANETR